MTLGLVGLLALTGCAVHPGAAAVVGQDSISTGQVDALAAGLCSANASSAQLGGQAMASRGARQGALQVLVDTDLSQQFGKQRGVVPDQKQISQALARSGSTIQALPADQRAAFKQALVNYWEGQLMLIDVGRKALEAQGRTHVTDAQAMAEGNRLRAQWAKHVTVSIDPRFGTFRRGSFQPAGDGGSISVPASDSARAGSATNPGAAWVSSLPASQKCG
jgi:hypothetical protein